MRRSFLPLDHHRWTPVDRLSLKRQRLVENEYGAFVRRVVRAYARRDVDVEALALMPGLSEGSTSP